MRTSTRTYVTALCVVLIFAPGCGKKSDPNDPNKAKAEPTPLFHHSESYWNFEKTKRELGYSNYETVEDRQPLVSDKRPAFRLLRIRVPQFKDNGYAGDLELWFYNDRLMRTQYYVSPIKAYVGAASGEQHFGLGSDMTGAMQPHTRLWVGKESDGRTYLGMEDQVLKQQMNDWITRYSNS